MKQDSGKAIQSYLMRMSKIVKHNATKTHLAQNRSLYAVAKTINKLDTQDLPEKLIEAHDLESDSLEKVSYYIDLALKTFENIRGPMLNNSQRSKFIFALSETYETLGHYGAALTNYKIALELATNLQNQSMQGQIQYRMARIFSQRGDWLKAQDLLSGAILTLETTGNHSEAALAQIELAKIAYRKGEYLKAKEIFKEALETTDRVSDVRSRAVVSNHLGIIRRMEGDHDLAHIHFQEALIEFQSIQDYHGTAESMNNLGLVHLRRKELNKAIDYFEKALQLCQVIGNFPLLAFVYSNKAEFYSEIGDYPMAANTCTRALEYLVRLKNPIGIAKINMLFGRIFWKSAEHKTAKAFYEESMSLYEEFCIPLGLANCYREYAQMLEETGSIEKAGQFYSKAQEIYKTLHIQMLAPESRSKIQLIQEAKKQTQLKQIDQVVSVKAEM
ncbi:MAG: tetratricopeptide repeat protein [bacterium]